MRAIVRATARIFASAFVIYTLVFFTVAVVPADPARALLGPAAPQDAVVQLRRELGMDRPLIYRYVKSLAGIFTGGFGESFLLQEPVTAVLRTVGPPTLVRWAVAIILGLLVGSAVGAAATRRVHGIVGESAIAFQSVPPFLLLSMAYWAATEFFGVSPSGAGRVYELIAVVCAAVYPATAVFSVAAHHLAEDRPPPRHIEFLRLLHLPHSYIRKVRFLELWPLVIVVVTNSALPALGAVLLAEWIFRLDGVGLVFFEACGHSDLSLVSMITLCVALVFLFVHHAGEGAAMRLDPRLARER